MDFLATISKMNRHTKYGALFAHVTAYTWAFFLLVPQYLRLTKTHYIRGEEQPIPLRLSLIHFLTLNVH